MQLTREERARIIAGDYSALRRKSDPGEVKGQEIPLVRRKGHKVSRYEDQQFSGQARNLTGYDEVPEYWSLWIELAETVRHRDGGWLVRFEVHDQRNPTRFLGPSAPPASSEAHEFTDETERGYQGSRRNAIDDLEAEGDDELARQRATASRRWQNHQEEVAAEELLRRQERAVRETIKESVRELPLKASQQLLAAIAREIRRARDVD